MVRMLQRYFGLAVLGLGVQFAAAYSLLGPYEGYQVPTIAYDLASDLGGPMNLGEEYRQNTPVLYYAFDQNFLDYFGASGVTAIEKAISIFNGLTNVSSYSPDLSEWPLESQRINYQAQALELVDLKSVTMLFFAEQAGLAEPDRYTWTLRDRTVGPGGCPADVNYLVVKRNFDPSFTPLDQSQASSYVNGTLYSYTIFERCSGTPTADAVEFSVDPLATTFTAVASFGLEYGGYYTGLTRDDVGGLRYLLRADNKNIESTGPNTFTLVTNNTTQVIITADLAKFTAAALTNNAAELKALYPDLIINSSSNYWVAVVTTNVTYYYTNYPWDVAGTLAHLVSSTNYHNDYVQRYQHTFGNLLTGPYYTNSLPYYTNGNITLITTNVGSSSCGAYALPGQVCTNVVSQTMMTNSVFGDFYIIPTNLCGISIISPPLSNIVYVTNIIAVATNAAGTTNVNGQAYSQSLVYSYTEKQFVINPVTCPTNTTALRQGIERVQYVRRDYDSLLNQYFSPITNSYILNAVTNNTLYPQKVQRVITRPDVLISARDLVVGEVVNIVSRTSGRYITNNALSGLAGPGTLDPRNEITFNKVGPIYYNHSPDFLEETNNIQMLIWGSFDGTTNAPIVYPNGTSITNLENQVLIQISPSGTALPDGTAGVNYTNAFSGFAVTGGTPPYAWSISPDSTSGLPSGLTLAAATGVISGVPAVGAVGVYDIIIRLTDAGARFVDRPYTITINP